MIPIPGELDNMIEVLICETIKDRKALENVEISGEMNSAVLSTTNEDLEEETKIDPNG